MKNRFTTRRWAPYMVGAVCLFAAGCGGGGSSGNSYSIVGTWNWVQAGNSQNTGTDTFSSNGTVTETDADGASGSGTYTYSNNRVTANVNGQNTEYSIKWSDANDSVWVGTNGTFDVTRASGSETHPDAAAGGRSGAVRTPSGGMLTSH